MPIARGAPAAAAGMASEQLQVEPGAGGGARQLVSFITMVLATGADRARRAGRCRRLPGEVVCLWKVEKRALN